MQRILQLDYEALGRRAIAYYIAQCTEPIMGLLCLSGTVAMLAYFVPVETGMAIVLWIGIVIVAQSFTATASHHAPAVVVGWSITRHCWLGCANC